MVVGEDGELRSEKVGALASHVSYIKSTNGS